jgi:hypothetical protein
VFDVRYLDGMLQKYIEGRARRTKAVMMRYPRLSLASCSVGAPLVFGVKHFSTLFPVCWRATKRAR